MYKVGDIVRLGKEKYQLVYASQNMQGKFRCKVIVADDYPEGYIVWLEPEVLKDAEKMGFKGVVMPTYKEGDQLVVVGGCCDNKPVYGKVVTYLRKLHVDDKNYYQHKIKVHIEEYGEYTMCVHCTKPNIKQMSLF